MTKISVDSLKFWLKSIKNLTLFLLKFMNLATIFFHVGQYALIFSEIWWGLLDKCREVLLFFKFQADPTLWSWHLSSCNIIRENIISPERREPRVHISCWDVANTTKWDNVLVLSPLSYSSTHFLWCTMFRKHGGVLSNVSWSCPPFTFISCFHLYCPAHA